MDLWGLRLHQRSSYSLDLYPTLSSLVLAYTPLKVTLLVPVRCTLYMVSLVFLTGFVTVGADHVGSSSSSGASSSVSNISDVVISPSGTGILLLL